MFGEANNKAIGLETIYVRTCSILTLKFGEKIELNIKVEWRCDESEVKVI